MGARHLAVLVLNHHRSPPAAALALLRAVAHGRRLPLPPLRARSRSCNRARSRSQGGSSGVGVTAAARLRPLPLPSSAARRGLNAEAERVELLAHARLKEHLRGAQAAEVGLGVARVDEGEAEDDARARPVEVGARLALVPRLDEAAEGGVEDALLRCKGGELVAEGGADGGEADAPAQAQHAVSEGVEGDGELVVSRGFGLLALRGARGLALRVGRRLLLFGGQRGT